MENLIELEELMNFLGYKSERSALNWCRKNSIPVEQFGKKKYADSSLFNSLISKSLGVENHRDFKIGHRAPDDAKSPGSGSSSGRQHSEAAQKFISKFKSEQNEKGAGNF